MSKNKTMKSQSVPTYEGQRRLLDALSGAGVRFMAFGDTALRGVIAKDFPDAQMRLWVDPKPENTTVLQGVLAQFSERIPQTGTDKLAQNLAAPPSWKPLVEIATETGLRRERAPSVLFYGSIAGHAPDGFDALYERSQKTIAFGRTRNAPAGSEPTGVVLPILAPADQVLNLRSSPSEYAKANLNALLNEALRQDVSIVSGTDKGLDQTGKRALSDDEQKRAKALYEDMARSKGRPDEARTIEAGKGFQQYVVNGKPIRDHEAIARELDLEAVIQTYGMVQDTSKNGLSSAWRLYRWPVAGDSERLGVAAIAGYDKKIYVNLGDQGQKGVFPALGERGKGDKGDTLSFIMRQEGDWRKMYEVIDRLALDPEFKQRQENLPTQTYQSRARTDAEANLRQVELTEKYNLKPIDVSDFLSRRYVHDEVQMDPAFHGQILQSTQSGQKVSVSAGERSTKDYAHVNTAFPLRNEAGVTISLDMRNDGWQRFPAGERGNGLWRSNDIVQFPQDMTLTDGTSVPSGTRMGMYKQHGQYTFTTGIDSALEMEDQKLVQFSMTPGKLKELLDVGQGPQRIPFNRIVITESSIDAISHKQLNPEKIMADGTPENRLYVATAGQPAKGQIDHIQKLMHKNPQAQLVLAMDGDNAGLRFMINMMQLQHPLENGQVKITPTISYRSPAKTLGELEADPARTPYFGSATEYMADEKKKAEEVSNQEYRGYNVLRIEMEAPPKAGINRAKEVHGGFVTDLVKAIQVGIPAEKLQNGDKERSVALVSQQTVLEKAMYLDQPASREQIEQMQAELKAGTRAMLPHHAGRELREGDPLRTLVPARLLTTAEILIPNDNRLLVSALNKMVGYHSEKQFQELFKVNRVNTLSTNDEGKAHRLKDFNDVLKDRKGREARPSDKFALDAPPKLLAPKQAYEQYQHQQQEKAQEEARKMAPKIVTFNREDAIKVNQGPRM